MSNGVDFRKMAVDLRAQLTTAEYDLAALREELATSNKVGTAIGETLGRVTAERDDLHKRLTGAEQRNSEASAILEIIYNDPEMLCAVTMEVARRTREFLTKPTESGASE